MAVDDAESVYMPCMGGIKEKEDNLSYYKWRNQKEIAKVFEDDEADSPWVSDDDQDDEHEDHIEYYSKVGCAVAAHFANEDNPHCKCSKLSWDKVPHKTRHSEGRLRNFMFHHTSVSGHHRGLPFEKHVEIAENFVVGQRIISYQERCEERRAWKRDKAKMEASDQAMGKKHTHGQKQSKHPRPPSYPPSKKQRQQQSSSSRAPLMLQPHDANKSRQVQDVIAEARSRLSTLAGQQESEQLAMVMANDIPISLMPPNRALTPSSHSRTVSVRAIELQFMKDQMDTAVAQLHNAARSLIDSVKDLNQCQKRIAEVSDSIGRVVTAIVEADEQE